MSLNNSNFSWTASDNVDGAEQNTRTGNQSLLVVNCFQMFHGQLLIMWMVQNRTTEQVINHYWLFNCFQMSHGQILIIQMTVPLTPEQMTVPLTPGQMTVPLTPEQMTVPLTPEQMTVPLTPGQMTVPLTPGQMTVPLTPEQVITVVLYCLDLYTLLKLHWLVAWI